ncbi:MAG TPA: hypothetical protein VJ781_09755 [Pyrinomonadaceae bacterium]|jgi:hypothetical protein|nr:hypothetical protein [Pyrinomonadaceae bacterium]
MPVWMKAAGKWGSILVIIALIITLLKNLIAFIGFLTFAFKVLIFLLFAAVIIGVGYLILRGISESRRNKD